MKSAVLSLVQLFIGSCIAASWDYTDPNSWGSSYSNCNGQKQSPINIETTNVDVDRNLGQFDKSIFSTPFTHLTYMNNGHSLQVDITDGAYTITDDSLFDSGDYKLAQFHLHWASSSYTGGSEHTIDGKRYFGELHLVHYNTKYASLSAAVSQDKGLAVLGFFIDASYPQDNTAFDRILNWNYALDTATDSVSVVSDMFSMETIMPCDMSVYYRYEGSLTTPTCDESVVWTVFKEPIKISVNQATRLATELKYTAGTTMFNNYRPVQNLNGRKVYKPRPYVQEESSSNLYTLFLAMSLANQNQGATGYAAPAPQYPTTNSNGFGTNNVWGLP